MDDLDNLVEHYNSVLSTLDEDAKNSSDRAYGGEIRAKKGKLQEYITENLVKIAWKEMSGDMSKLEINSKKINIPIQYDYIKNIKDGFVKEHIFQNLHDYIYKLSVDKHIFIDNRFVIGIECKAYTENAMIKRIMVDFELLKMQYPNISCYLFQLESQLGGDYSHLKDVDELGSKPTHTIMGYFPLVDLNIFTFLKGERDVNKPIHKYFKPLSKDRLQKAVDLLKQDLNRYKVRKSI